MADPALGSCSDPRLLTRRLLGCLSSNCVWEREPHPLQWIPNRALPHQSTKECPTAFCKGGTRDRDTARVGQGRVGGCLKHPELHEMPLVDPTGRNS